MRIKMKKIIYLIPLLIWNYGCVGSYQEVTNDEEFMETASNPSWDRDLDGPPPQTHRKLPLKRSSLKSSQYNFYQTRRGQRVARRYFRAHRYYSRKIRYCRRKIANYKQQLKALKRNAGQYEDGRYPRWYARAIIRFVRKIRFYKRLIFRYQSRLFSLKRRLIARYGSLPPAAMKGRSSSSSSMPRRPPQVAHKAFSSKKFNDPALPLSSPKPTLPSSSPRRVKGEDPTLPSRAPSAGRLLEQLDPTLPSRAPQVSRSKKKVDPALPQYPPSSDSSLPSTPPPSSSNSSSDMLPTTPPPSSSNAFNPSTPSSASVEAWRSYCTSEKEKYSSKPKPSLIGDKRLELASFSWKLHILKNVSSDSITPLYSANRRYTLLGQGGRFSFAHCEDRPFFLWDNVEQKLLTVRPPTTKFLLGHPRLFSWLAGVKKRAIEEQLIEYNPAQNRGSLLLKIPTSSTGKIPRYHYFFFKWNLSSNRIERAWPLGRAGCSDAYKIVGISPTRSVLYFLENVVETTQMCGRNAVKQGEERRHFVKALDLRTGRMRILATLNHRYRIESVVPNRTFSKIAIVEYAEMKYERGKVFLCETTSGRILSHYIPRAPYGVSFSPDQRFLFVYGSKNGILMKIPLNPILRKRSLTTHRRGHALGFSRDGRLLLSLFHNGILLRDAKSLDKKAFIALRKIIGPVKFLHVDGSIILGGVLFIKNSDKLYIQTLVSASHP